MKQSYPTEKAESLWVWGLVAVAFLAGMIFFRPLLINFFYSTVPFIVILGLLVFVHEFGHFFAAKRAGMTVHEFAIGMGPALWTTKKKSESEDEKPDGQTYYSLRAIPLGGYVRIAGMEPNEDPNEKGAFSTKPWGWRFVTLVAGCVMNFVLAALLFCILGTFVGIATYNNSVDGVVKDYPAAKAGLKPGDKIVAVDGLQTEDVALLRSKIESHPGLPIHLSILRNHQQLQVTLTPKKEAGDNGQDVGRIGITFNQVMEKVNPIAALGAGIEETWNVTHSMLNGLLDMVTRRAKVLENLGGPVMIFQQTGTIAQKGGMSQLVWWAAILSINLGILNLLPIPALDGGRILFLLVEAVRGRRLDPKKEAYIHLAGFVLLAMFILFVTYHDLQRIVRHWF